MSNSPLNIFYEEPNPDRWIKYDRYPRSIFRRILRGKQRSGGVMIIAINLMKGLDKLGVLYRFNDYRYIRNHPEEIACILGKPHVLFDKPWRNPIIFGAGIYSHPMECPELFVKYPNVKRFLVPGEWMRKMCEPYYMEKVVDWAVGIDTEYWHPETTSEKHFDFLIYDKIRWERQNFESDLINPITKILDDQNLTYHFIRYGTYDQSELKNKLANSKAVLFMCEHETQGLAYQQILSTDVPILAWDRGGYWEDPAYYPHKVRFKPVSSVPYWSDDCGVKFEAITDFQTQLETFIKMTGQFKPRKYILENLTLEKSALRYLEIYHQIEMEIK